MTSDASTPGGRGDRVEATLALEAQLLGLAPPPADLHLRLAADTNGWRIYGWVRSPGHREAAIAWLLRHPDLEGEPVSTTQPRVFCVNASSLPARVVEAVTTFDVRMLRLSTDGMLHLTLVGARADLRAFLGGLEGPERQRAIESVVPASEAALSDPLLTGRQQAALLQAVAAGYFEVPRQLRLSELAEAMEMSQGALSVLLRRAERKLVHSYAERLAQGMLPGAPTPGTLEDELR